ncbi:MAG: site-2 protease family protein [Bacteroidetes bacterium]|nr:site-2 protease family protein [Bacteroidota bacterium]
MKENKYSPQMTMKDDSLLEYYLKNPQMFPDEEVQAARWELEKRGIISDDKQPPVKEELENSETIIFPPKPAENSQERSFSRSLLSLALFIVAFYFMFKWDFTSIFILVGVLLIHEAGHLLAMKYFDYKELSMFFVPLVGALAMGSKDQISQKQSIIISMAGPVPGIILGIITYLLFIQTESAFLEETAYIFIVLNLFNLLPVMPLDGGRVLKTTFFEKNDMLSKIFIILSIALLSYYFFSIESYFLLIIPAFLFLQFMGQSSFKRIREDMAEKNFDVNKSYNELTDEEYWRMREEIGVNGSSYSNYIIPNHYEVSEKEPKIIQFIKSILYKKPIMDLGIGGKMLVVTIWVLSFLVPLGVLFFI